MLPVAVGAAIATLIVLALVIAVALPHEETTYPAGSPEAAFQDFYRAWETGDLDAAYGRLSPDVTVELSLSEYKRMDREYAWQRDQARRLVLEHADVTGDRGVLRIRVDEYLQGGQRTSFDRSIRLIRLNDAWLIDEPLVGIESVVGAY